MPEIDHRKYYTPTNDDINITWTQNKEVRNSSSTRVRVDEDGARVNIDNSSSTTVTGYTIQIKYDGPVNIGERVISQERIPNYWNSAIVIAEATEETGVLPYGSWWRDPYSTFGAKCAEYLGTFLCMRCWCVPCCIDPWVARRRERHNGVVDRIACDRMSRDVADLLKVADQRITARIQDVDRRDAARASFAQQQQQPRPAPQQQQQQPRAAAEPRLTPEQAQEFEQFQKFKVINAAASNAAASKAAASKAAAANDPSGGRPALVAPQYQQHQQGQNYDPSAPPPPYYPLEDLSAKNAAARPS